jgi:NAD(P)-dependent dehydrogenase (short-subunit alcohol dehydrogenase family)
MQKKIKAKKGLPTLSELVSLKGKRALITGSGSGIGRAMAWRFAEAGGNLELVDINEESLDVVRQELKQFNVEVNVHKVNLSRKEEIDALWRKLDGKEPSILVNNAGIYPSKSFLDVDEAFLEKVMDINLNSVFWMCQHMIRTRLKKRRSDNKPRFNRSHHAPERRTVSLRYQQGRNHGSFKSPSQRIRKAWLQNKRPCAGRRMDARNSKNSERSNEAEVQRRQIRHRIQHENPLRKIG